MRVVFDSSILIDELRGYPPAVDFFKNTAPQELTCFVSVITETELYSGKKCNTPEGLESVNEILSLFTIINVDREIAKKAGEFRRKYGVDIPDAIVAATAFYQNCKIWTKNIEDFKKIKEIEAEDPY